jgi:hypothetical protein
MQMQTRILTYFNATYMCKNKKQLITIVLFLLTVQSWAQVSVIINNKSGVDRSIRVSYPDNFKIPISESERTNDSLTTYDHTLTANSISTRDYYRYPSKTAILNLDTVTRTYSFILKAKHEVVVEFRNNATKPTFGQIFTIDGLEAIELKKHGKLFIKSPKLLPGGAWTYTINDAKN